MTGTVTPAITLEDVGVIYPGGITPISDITLRLNTGSVCGLVGMNGAGKSTLFKVMMGLVPVKTGTVRVFGEPVHTALKKNRIAYAPQTENVDWNFPVRVKDVVMMGRYGHMGFLRHPRQVDHAAVATALARVGLEGLASRPIGELSGGQKKRVFVARALAQQAPVLLLDEPFAGVDITTEKTLSALLRDVASQGCLVIVSTHNLGSVPDLCDQAILINQTLIAHGPVDQVFTADHLSRAFGGMLRQQHLIGPDLHDDDDGRSVSVLTDDERPLVFYGTDQGKKIMTPKGTE